MKDLAKKKNEDLENVRKKIDELVGYAWERGYKCGQADCEEPVEAEHKICIGDIVTTPLGNLAIIIGIEEWNDTKLASIYSEYYALPQMFPVQDLKATGVHKDVKSMLLDLLKENANEQDS